MKTFKWALAVSLFAFTLVNQQSYAMAPAPFRGFPNPPYKAPATPNQGEYGFNTIWMHGLLNNAPSTAVSETTQALSLMNQPPIRFPGGTIANFYHFRGQGYGNWENGQPAPAGENFIVKFAEIVATAKAPVSYVLNVAEHFRYWFPKYTGTDEALMAENLEAIEYLLKRGIKIPMVEIGNELTIYGGNFGLNLVQLPSIAGDQAKVEAMVSASVDRYLNVIIPTYKTKVTELLARYGQPAPKFGVPVHPIFKNGMYYGDARYFTSYWNYKMKNAPVDAVVHHIYMDVGADPNPTATLQKGRDSINQNKVVMQELASFFPGKKFWITEFNFIANDANGRATSNVNLDGPIHNQLLEDFKTMLVPSFPIEYYFMHLFFIDGPQSSPLYKKIFVEGTAHPVNGKVLNGVTIPDPQYGKQLFASPLLCWSAKTRKSNENDQLILKSAFGCP